MIGGEKYKYLIAFCDWIVLVFAFALAMELHARGTVSVIFSEAPFLPERLLFFMAYALCGLVVFQYNNLYNINVFLTLADQTVRLLESILYLVVGFTVLSFFAKSYFIVNSRLTLLLFIPISLLFLLIERFVIFSLIFKFLAKHNLYQRRTIIIGAGKLGKLLAANLSLTHAYGVKILGFLDDDYQKDVPVFRGIRSIGSINDIAKVSSEQTIDEIVICVEGIGSEKLLEILEQCIETGIQVKIASPLYDIVETFRFTERYGEIPVVGLGQTASSQGRDFVKRAFDMVLALLGMVFLAPVFAAMAVAIKFDSSGPVLYRQTRVGKNGRLFAFYKFRSMLVGSDQDETRKQKVAKLIRGEISNGAGDAKIDTKIVDESKITRVGRFIRKTSLDELPQLINVLKGDMSLVGPRPCLPYEWEHYEEWQKKRLNCVPGCTGVWQVSGRNAIGFNDMVILDFYYIQNASLFLDLQLILKTIPVMVFGKGGK